MAEPERLPAGVRIRITDRRTDVFFSAVNIWEAAIKYALKRPDFRTHPDRLIRDATDASFTELPVTAAAAARVGTLPLHHRDPFDRLLVAQAMEADAVLVTVDAALAAYGSPVLMLGPEPGRVP